MGDGCASGFAAGATTSENRDAGSQCERAPGKTWRQKTNGGTGAIPDAAVPEAAVTPRLRHDDVDDLPVDVRQPEVPALVREGQPRVVDAEQVQHRRVQVVDVHRVLDDVEGEVVGLAVGRARLAPAARHPDGERPRKEAALIEFGRQLFGPHTVTSETYASALEAVGGSTNLVDLVDLMAQHVSDAVLLIAFDQHLPAGVEPLLTTP